MQKYQNTSKQNLATGYTMTRYDLFLERKDESTYGNQCNYITLNRMKEAKPHHPVDA